MRVIEQTVFNYSELSESAQSAAREWYRRDYEFFTEFVIDDAETVAGILGIEFDRARGRTSAPAVYWSGFWSQGDGASFTGSWSYAKGSTRAIRAYAPQDAALHRIADTLQRAARVSFYRASARVTVSGRYSHSGTMRVECDDCHNVDCEDDVADALRSFADWIYRQLESEYEHSMSDEVVAENLECNDYEFTEEGKLA